MNTKNTQKETTKKASAPETRITVAEIREAGGKFHIYTLPGGFYHCTCVNREDAEEVMAERFPPATGEGNAPRVDWQALAISRYERINELISLCDYWQGKHETLEARNAELLAASKRFYTIADKLDHDSISTDLWNEYVVAQDAFKDAIDNAEGSKQ